MQNIAGDELTWTSRQEQGRDFSPAGTKPSRLFLNPVPRAACGGKLRAARDAGSESAANSAGLKPRPSLSD